MRILLLLFCCLIAAPTVLAQTQDELKALALAQAKITSNATVAEDYETVFNYTLPAVLDLMGGRTQALALTKDAMNSMKEQGMKITKSEVLKMVGFAFEQEEYRCVIENNIVVKMSDSQSMDSISYTFGIYSAEDAQWYFIEAAEMKNKALMNAVLPDLKTELVIPDDVRKMVQN